MVHSKRHGEILRLLQELQQTSGTAVLFITHDLGVVAGMADSIIVMYAGKVFERASAIQLFERPANPYTKGLLMSVPDPLRESTARGELYQIPGLPPDPANLPPGCPFAPRCDKATDICRKEFPPMVQVAPGHESLCHFAKEVYGESANLHS